ncbi:MAG TPA: TolC family protein [Bryobacteraceae bacterium]|nr:TolC family protein [Bryobacteraceae bacterium]
MFSLCALLAGAVSLCAQQSASMEPVPAVPQGKHFKETYDKGLSEGVNVPVFPRKAWFRQHFRPEIPRVQLRPPTRLMDFVVDGKLELSLKAYMELVLANNTDIEIQRLSVELPKNAITRAAGIFDPFARAQFSSTRANTATSDLLAGAASLSQLNQPWNALYQQTLSTGTQLTAGYSGQKFTSNSSNVTFNPAFTSNMNLNLTQPLLRGRGRDITRLPITIARSRLRAAQYDLADTLLRLVATAETAYWNVIEARENLRVQEKALELADVSLKRSQKELELGAASELEIYQPQAVYANAEIFVTQARYRLAQTEDQLRRQIAADLDSEVRKLPIVLTEPVTVPNDNREFDKEALVTLALRLRPDLLSDVQALDVDELNIKAAKNALLPLFNLGGGYTTAGRGGVFYPRQSLLSTAPVTPIPGGFGDALDQMFGFGFPTYNFSLTLTLPIRDRRAAADLADAAVNRKRDMLTLRTDQQQARLDVLTAINQVEQSRASVKLAVIARDLAQKRMEAEQKKYDLGISTTFLVLAAQSDLTNAESNMVTQSVAYRRALLLLQQRTGELLSDRGVVVP